MDAKYETRQDAWSLIAVRGGGGSTDSGIIVVSTISGIFQPFHIDNKICLPATVSVSVLVLSYLPFIQFWCCCCFFFFVLCFCFRFILFFNFCLCYCMLCAFSGCYNFCKCSLLFYWFCDAFFGWRWVCISVYACLYMLDEHDVTASLWHEREGVFGLVMNLCNSLFVWVCLKWINPGKQIYWIVLWMQHMQPNQTEYACIVYCLWWNIRKMQ